MVLQILTTNKADTGERKTLLPEEEATSMQLMTLLNFEGVLQHSPMFYGYYSNRQSSDTGYRLPTAYFITGLAVYIYSFVATLRKYIFIYIHILPGNPIYHNSRFNVYLYVCYINCCIEWPQTLD